MFLYYQETTVVAGWQVVRSDVSLQVDALCCARTEGDSQSGRRVKTELLKCMTAARSSSAQVLVLAATNCPASLDCALRRRFSQVSCLHTIRLFVDAVICLDRDCI